MSPARQKLLILAAIAAVLGAAAVWGIRSRRAEEAQLAGERAADQAAIAAYREQLRDAAGPVPGPTAPWRMDSVAMLASANTAAAPPRLAEKTAARESPETASPAVGAGKAAVVAAVPPPAQPPSAPARPSLRQDEGMAACIGQDFLWRLSSPRVRRRR